jgi:tetratricopeptide (TPR) repeat protein
VKLQAGDQAGALAAYQESVDIARKLVALDQGNAAAQRGLFVSLHKVGDVKLQTGDQATALAAYQESLDIARKLVAQDPGNAQAQSDLVNALGSTADAALLVKDYANALALSDEATTLAPDQLWLYDNRATALMLLGRTDEARAVYLAYRGKMANPTMPWEQAVEDGFVELRKAGVSNPLMDEIEAEFAKAALPAATK